MPDPPPLTILHISDIQFGHKHRCGRLGDASDAALDTLLARLIRDLDDLREGHGLKPDLLVVSGDLALVPTESWTWYRLEDLHVVVAGLNATQPEIHGDEAAHKAIKDSSTSPRTACERWIRDGTCGHFGRCGERQLRWFANRLKPFVADGWLRIGVLHHNPVRGPENDDES